MAHFDFSEFSSTQLEGIAQDCLNKFFKIHLVPFTIEKGAASISPDLWEVTEYDTVRTIVDIKGTQNISADEARGIVDKLEFYDSEYSPDRIILFAFSEINHTAQVILQTMMSKGIGNKGQLIDIKAIEETLLKFPEIIDKWGIKTYSEKSAETRDVESSDKESIIEELKANSVSGKPRQFFVGGHVWGKEDQLPRFIKDSIWENGHKNKVTSAVNSTNVGDIIFAKTTWVKAKTQGMLTLRAVGVVKENPKDGHLLKVNWHEFSNKIDLSVGSQYRYTYQKIQENTLDDLLDGILSEYPNLLEIIYDLRHEHQSNLPDISQIIRAKLNSDDQFWWLTLPKGSNIDELKVGDVLEVGKLENARSKSNVSKQVRNVQDLEKAQLIIGCQAQPNKEVVGIFQVGNENKYEIRLLYKLDKRITLQELRHLDLFSKSGLNGTLQGALHKLDQSLFKEIINTTELGNEENNWEETQPEVDELYEESNSNDNIPFHLDQVEEIDRLNREPVAKTITRLLNGQIFSSPLRKRWIKRKYYQLLNWLLFPWRDKSFTKSIRERHSEVGREKISRHAFMIHLQGAWGNGKSTFLNLIRKNLNTEKNKWIVVEFNAWQNQHILPPWWTFLDQVYKQAIARLPIHKRIIFWLKEQTRRLVNLKLIYRLSVLILFLLILFTTYAYIPEIVEIFSEDQNVDDNSIRSNIINFGKFLGAAVGISGVIYSFSQFLIRPLFLKSPESAKSFVEKVADPMVKVKKHFESIVDNLEIRGFRLAIFIDDLDRCNATFTVQLLEGIQTLYKDRKVLYIVAGDKNWISNCFESNYEKFSPVVKEPAQKLGYLFLEKAFQLSIRLPHISEKTKKEYWNYILFPEGNKAEVQTIEIPERSEEENLKLREEFKTKYKKAEYSNLDQYEQIGNELRLTESEVTDFALENLNSDQEDIIHILQNHHDLIESNPRNIKRLANQYNIYRDTLIAERKSFDSDKLFRWLVLQNVYPLYVEHVEREGKIFDQDNLPEELLSLKSNEHWKRLVNDPSKERGGKLQISDFEMFVGYSKEEDIKLPTTGKK